MTDRLQIIVDTREQQPWRFPEHLVRARRDTLKSGDYALDGDLLFAIERKGLDDFLGSVAGGWDRLQAEFARMAVCVARVVIVEGSAREIVEGAHSHPSLTAPFVFKRVAQLTLGGVSVLFADSPTIAAGLAYSIFKERQNEREELGDVGGGGSAGEAESGVALPEAGQPVDDFASCPKHIGAKVRRQRSGEVRAPAWGPAQAIRDMDALGL
jgi:ERCC4-type nuclease